MVDCVGSELSGGLESKVLLERTEVAKRASVEVLHGGEGSPEGVKSALRNTVVLLRKTHQLRVRSAQNAVQTSVSTSMPTPR